MPKRNGQVTQHSLHSVHPSLNKTPFVVRIEDPTVPRDPAEGLNPKVVEVYTKYVLNTCAVPDSAHRSSLRVGFLLQKGKYRSGPLPKAFKIIPSLPAWARILSLTQPENWSPQACRAATRIFVSNMKPAQARMYLQGVVLDAVREDIRESGKLSPHYYEALKKGLYKPGAFFKGIIFPLLEVCISLRIRAETNINSDNFL